MLLDEGTQILELSRVRCVDRVAFLDEAADRLELLGGEVVVARHDCAASNSFERNKCNLLDKDCAEGGERNAIEARIGRKLYLGNAVEGRRT